MKTNKGIGSTRRKPNLKAMLSMKSPTVLQCIEPGLPWREYVTEKRIFNFTLNFYTIRKKAYSVHFIYADISFGFRSVLRGQKFRSTN